MANKADVIAKVDELRAVANDLPDSPAKIALHNAIGRLTGVAYAALADDGMLSPAAQQFVPNGGLMPMGGGDGDGHAVTCC